MPLEINEFSVYPVAKPLSVTEPPHAKLRVWVASFHVNV